MNKQTIITILLAFVTMAGQAQTKTATITGYSPALKDGTVAESSIDNIHSRDGSYCVNRDRSHESKQQSPRPC